MMGFIAVFGICKIVYSIKIKFLHRLHEHAIINKYSPVALQTPDCVIRLHGHLSCPGFA